MVYQLNTGKFLVLNSSVVNLVGSGLNLTNKTVILIQQSFKFSLQCVNFWVWNCVIDLLDSLGSNFSSKSFSILLNDVESRLELHKFRSESSVS